VFLFDTLNWQSVNILKKMPEKSLSYSNDEITVIWEPHKCIHSGNCVRKLPLVFSPAQRPWVNVLNADTEKIKVAIDLCPSGALSYLIKNNITMENESIMSIKIVPNGPILVGGNVEITDQKGNKEIKETMFALCRCGGSHKKPYCDGSHNIIGFQDDK
jgi:uncharacterized Fe-S cluster protein YjdI